MLRGGGNLRKHQHMHHRLHHNLTHPPRAAPPPGSSGRRQRSRLYAQRPDVAALEAALGAINKILGAYNNRAKPPGAPTQPGAPPSPQGKSKLIKFRARANSSVTVKELLSVPDDSPPDSSSSSSSSSSAPAHDSLERHTHASRRSAVGQAASKANQPQHFEGQLQAYLSLPLDEYALLDPSLISRLPDGCDVDAYLSEQLEQQQQRRAARKQPPPPGQQQLLAGLQQADASEASGSSSGDSSSSSDGVRGVSLEPKMRALDEPPLQQQQQQDSQQQPDAGHVNEVATSNSRGSSSSSPADGPLAAAPAGAGSLQPVPVSAPTSTGFLLRIPMLELLGVDLEPLLVIFVDIDPHKAQVRFHTDRLVVGNAPQFNREFKVALTALLTSKPQRAAVPIEAGGAGSDAGAAAAAAGADAGVAAADAEQAASPAAAGSSSGTDEQQQRRPQWQRSSSLSCKVELQMTLRLPHPLSIVPGPLLSTAASLVAKLVMQALLPSFLELLASDYGRWASGTSTASRQAVAAGSLLAAGKQQLQRMGR